MEIDLDLFKEALRQINSDGELKKVKLSDKTLSFLVDYNIPKGIIDFFNRFSFDQHINMYPFIKSMNYLVKIYMKQIKGVLLKGC